MAFGSVPGEPRPINREMRYDKRDEPIGNPRVECAPLVTVPSEDFESDSGC